MALKNGGCEVQEESRNQVRLQSCRNSDESSLPPLNLRRNAVKKLSKRRNISVAVEVPLMPYEWELPRMRNERLHNKNVERVISEHDRVYHKCLMKSESAAICIDRATDEI